MHPHNQQAAPTQQVHAHPNLNAPPPTALPPFPPEASANPIAWPVFNATAFYLPHYNLPGTTTSRVYIPESNTMYLMHIPHAYNNPMLRRFLSNHRETHPMRSTLLRHVTFTQVVNATPIHVPVPQQTDSTTRSRVNRVVAPQPAAVPVFYHQLLPQQQRCVFHTLVPLIICFWQIRNNNVFPLQRSYSVIRAAWSWQYICPTTALHAESANAKTASNPTSTSGYYRVAFVRFWGGIVFLCLILPLELSAFFPVTVDHFILATSGALHTSSTAIVLSCCTRSTCAHSRRSTSYQKRKRTPSRGPQSVYVTGVSWCFQLAVWGLWGNKTT